MGIDTLPVMLEKRAKERPTDTAMLRKEFGIWHKITWSQYLESVKHLSLGLIRLGLQKGDKVVFISTNRPEWMYTEMAVMAAHAVPLGMYPESEDIEDFQKLIDWSDGKFIVAEDQEQVDKVLRIRDRLPRVERIIVIEFHEVRRYKEPMLLPFQEVLKLGRKLDQEDPEMFERNTAGIKLEDVAIMSTTSGTSALPKLVMLTHKNLVSAAQAINSRDSLTRDDKIVSSNPPAWIGERAFSVCWGVLTGFCTCFVEKEETMDRDFREIGPTVLFVGPRTWDNMISKILVRMEDAGFLNRKTYAFFMFIATKVLEFRLIRREKVPLLYRFLYAMGEQAVYKHLRDLLGLSKMRNAYTGGGFLGTDQFVFIHAMGVKLRQIYGITEGGGITISQAQNDFRPDTVGTVLPGMKVKIDETGEILIGGENVMVGYYRNAEATAETLKEGWLHTGDFGSMAEETGHVCMLDRKKDIMTLNNGHRFSPQAIETKLKFSPYIKEAVCFGDGRDYVASLIQINMDNVGKWAEQRHIPYTTFRDLSVRPEVRRLIEKEVKDCFKTIANDLKIARFALLNKELDPEDGEITHTRKLRRVAINEIYKKQIEALYSDGDEMPHDCHVVKIV